jgi:hypothetical protein
MPAECFNPITMGLEVDQALTSLMKKAVIDFCVGQ